MRVPSLSERHEDIPELMHFFCARACESHGFARLHLSPAAIQAGQASEWPGNVRQLAHAVEAAVVRAAGDRATSVDREHLFPIEWGAQPKSQRALTFQQATRQFQEQLLRETLRATEWNIPQTAQRLDVASSHVYDLIRSFQSRKRAV